MTAEPSDDDTWPYLQALLDELGQAEHQAVRDLLVDEGGRVATAAHLAGRMSSRDLAQWFGLYLEETVRTEHLWPNADQLARQAVRQQRQDENDETGVGWLGTYPLGMNDPRPGRGVPVVYVLYLDVEPIYAGSSDYFTGRLAAHRRDDKDFNRWRATACADRAAAYALEDRLLKQHLPTLNRRRGS